MTVKSSAYIKIPKFHVAVDCIIFTVIDGALKILLVKRDFEPEKGKWSLIGGFVGEKESVDHAARRVLRELTGIDNSFIRQLGTFGDINRDPGARVISVAYFALLNIADIDNEAVKSHKAVWTDVNNLPELGFDHPRMIDRGLTVMRKNTHRLACFQSAARPVHHDSLLQTLVESVIGKTLDKRNFRKRIADNPEIIATDLIDKESSKRGARLYRYAGQPC